MQSGELSRYATTFCKSILQFQESLLADRSGCWAGIKKKYVSYNRMEQMEWRWAEPSFIVVFRLPILKLMWAYY